MRVCARVLAAALMTGGIASALALPALVGQPGEAQHGLSAPPVSHGRTLHLPSLSGTSTASGVGRPKRTVSRPAALASAAIPARSSGVVSKQVSSAPRSTPPARKPAPAPSPSPAPKPPPTEERQFASEPPPSQPAATPPPSPPAGDSCADGEHDDGDDDGH